MFFGKRKKLKIKKTVKKDYCGEKKKNKEKKHVFDDFVRLALKGLKRGTADGQFFFLFIGHGENGDGRSLLSDKMWSKSITQLVSTRKLSNQQIGFGI